MLPLISRFLRPYRSALLIVAVLTTMQVIANLYLPFLNADIINNGVVTGDIGYIVRTGAIMLGLSAGLAAISVIAVAPTSETEIAAICAFLRSYMSASAPAGIASRAIGRKVAVCTMATMSAPAIVAIAQAEPTPWIRKPVFEIRLAHQTLR